MRLAGDDKREFQGIELNWNESKYICKPYTLCLYKVDRQVS